MPIYEYQCRSCQYEFEAIQKMSANPLTDCPECHEAALKKKISAAAFRLSGSGWYETDFKKAGDKKKNLVGDAARSKDDKPAVKTESSKKNESKAAKTTAPSSE